jgi:Fe-S cluster biogenesis protein NfuA
MKVKPKMTKAQLTQRVNEEAKRMRDDIKRQGGNLTFSECKKEARKVFIEEYEIV